MNKQELIKAVIELPVDCSGSRPKIDKLTTLELIKLLKEPEKVQIPQMIAEWLKKCKTFKYFTTGLSFALQPSVWEANGLSGECIEWLTDAENQDTFARAWLDGYEVEKEKRYRVKMKNIIIDSAYLKHQLQDNHWYWGSLTESNEFSSSHTKNELEDAGFGWVFSCEGIEIEEAE